jgi:phosphoribosylformylglycinamidine cyclo-ligase
VVAGIAEGCAQAGAALIGGETAEMPDMYPDGEYDLAGFCVGVVERDELIDGSRISAGDALIGIGSSGPHSNGYSLIRKVMDIADDADADALIEPTRIYVKSVLALKASVDIKGLSHITGGGITENLPRVIPDGLHAVIDTGSWDQGPVFDWLARHGNIETDEMRRTFNCGVGMVVAVPNDELDAALEILREHGETAWRIGEISRGTGPVTYL